MTLTTLLIIILILVLIGAFPSWPHAQNWGYGPSGIVGILLIVLLYFVASQFGGSAGLPPLRR